MIRRLFLHPITFITIGLIVLALADETWLMPGPVSAKHAPIEAECDKCHADFAGAPNTKCLSCKKQMNYVEDRGIHKFAPMKECVHCHREHRTRAYPLASAWVSPTSFDHSWTGYELGKYHKETVCDKCHPKGNPYRDVKLTCTGCHNDFNPVLWDHAAIGCVLGYARHDSTQPVMADSLHAQLSCESCHTDGWEADAHPKCEACHDKGMYEPRDICLPPQQ